MSYELVPQRTGFLKPDVVSPFFPAQFDGIIRRDDFAESIVLINAALKPPESMNKWYRLPFYIAALESVILVIAIVMLLSYGSQTDSFGFYVYGVVFGVVFYGMLLCIPCVCSLTYLGQIWAAYRKKSLNAVVTALNAQYSEHCPPIRWRLIELITVSISSSRRGTSVSQHSDFKILVEAIRPNVIVIVNNNGQERNNGPYNEFGYQQPQQQHQEGAAPHYGNNHHNYQQQPYGGYHQPAPPPRYQEAIALQSVGQQQPQTEGAFKGHISTPPAKPDNMKTGLLSPQDKDNYSD